MPCQAWHRLVECTVLLNQRCPYCTTTLMTHSFFASCIFGDVSTGAASRGRQREGSRGGMVSMTNAGWGAAFFLLNTSEVMLVWLARAAMSGLHACGGPWPTGQPYGPLAHRSAVRAPGPLVNRMGPWLTGQPYGPLAHRSAVRAPGSPVSRTGPWLTGQPYGPLAHRSAVQAPGSPVSRTGP